MHYKNWQVIGTYRPMRFFRFSSTLIACITCAGIVTHAQNNYWTQQYSAYATLTGGACMSCPKDNSVFYYNPGALGFMDTMGFSVSANLYGYDHMRLVNGVGEGLDLVSNRLSITAQVLAGNLSFKRAPKLKVVYGYLLRNFSRFNVEQETDMQFDAIMGSPGLEFYRARFEFEFSNMEYWAGLAAGYRFNDHISIGLGHYGGFINTRTNYLQQVSADAVNPQGQPYIASALTRQRYHLNHLYILFKPGIDIRFGKVKIGLSAMLPSTKIWSRGKVYQTLQTSNMDVYNTDTSNLAARYPDFIIEGSESDIKTTYKLPASISAGWEYQDKNFRIALMVEYFFGLKEYSIIDGGDNIYIRPQAVYGTQPVNDFMRIRTGSYPVINAAVGVDVRVSRKISILSGFRTDFNNKIPLLKKDFKDYISPLNPEYWHYLHYSLGISLRGPNSRTFLGITYKQGFSNYHRNFANYTNPSDIYLLSGPESHTMRTIVHGVSFVVGYTNFSGNGTPFKNKKGKKQLPPIMPM